MFTQFFGNYLFNEKLVTKQQLIEALEMQKFARAKLGVLAINAGYMTGAQVDEVHAEQQRMDKRFGDIAVDKGYMTEEQVEELLKNQKQSHLVIGQALVDKGYLTNEQFADALAKYKENNLIEEREFGRAMILATLTVLHWGFPLFSSSYLSAKSRKSDRLTSILELSRWVKVGPPRFGIPSDCWTVPFFVLIIDI